jgi:hypothetical protein
MSDGTLEAISVVDGQLPAHEKPLAAFSRHATQDRRTGRVRESARSSYFRRKCGELSALQRVYGQQHNY